MEKGLGIPKVTSIQYPPDDQSWELEMLDVIKEISGERPSGATGSDGLAVLRVIEGNK
jgi:predicted dehydrogenase